MGLPLNYCVFTCRIKEVVRSVLEQAGCKQRTEEDMDINKYHKLLQANKE